MACLDALWGVSPWELCFWEGGAEVGEAGGLSGSQALPAPCEGVWIPSSTGGEVSCFQRGPNMVRFVLQDYCIQQSGATEAG